MPWSPKLYLRGWVFQRYSLKGPQILVSTLPPSPSHPVLFFQRKKLVLTKVEKVAETGISQGFFIPRLFS